MWIGWAAHWWGSTQLGWEVKSNESILLNCFSVFYPVQSMWKLSQTVKRAKSVIGRFLLSWETALSLPQQKQSPAAILKSFLLRSRSLDSVVKWELKIVLKPKLFQDRGRIKTNMSREWLQTKAWSECMGKCNNEFSVKEQFYILLSQGRSIRLLLLLLSMSEEDSKSSKGVWAWTPQDSHFEKKINLDWEF